MKASEAISKMKISAKTLPGLLCFQGLRSGRVERQAFLRWLLTIMVLFIFLLPNRFFSQHNSDYVQYMFNGLLLNPAYAGSHDALNLTALYRNQWSGITGAPVNLSLGAHTPLKNERLNIGLVVENDRFGVADHTRAGVIYAYRIKVFRGKLSFGLKGGIDSYSSARSRLTTHDPDDPNFTVNTLNSVRPDAGAGLYYYSGKIYFGYSTLGLLDHWNRYRLMMLNSGCILNLSEEIKMKPAFLLKYLYHSPVSVNLSDVFYYKDILGLGCGYTFKTFLLFFADVKLNEQFHFGYGYERPLSRIRYSSGGSHEVMLRYLFRYKIKANSARYF